MHPRRWFLQSTMVVFAMSASAVAQVVVPLPLDRDPQQLGVELRGNARWHETGGLQDRGYLSLTSDASQTLGAVVFPDVVDPPGAAWTSFLFRAAVRVGGEMLGHGMSINFAHPEDPVVSAPLDSFWAIGPGADVSQPEEGALTGLSIGFDEQAAGQANDDCGSLSQDCVGMSIRVDGELISQVAFPVMQGSLSDNASLQTAVAPEDWGWAELEVMLFPSFLAEEYSQLKVRYKDRLVYSDSIRFPRSPLQLVFAAPVAPGSSHDIGDIHLFSEIGHPSLPHDFNADGQIDAADFGILATNMNTAIPPQLDDLEGFHLGDVDISGRVDIVDFAIFRREFSRGVGAVTVAEPSGNRGLLLLFLVCWGRGASLRRAPRRGNP